MEFSFDGKVALVTGAAHGIGQSICVELSKRGAVVWATDILVDDLSETERVCRDVGIPACARGLDVTDEAAVNGVVAEILNQDGSIDILVNVAGGVLGQVAHPLEEVSSRDWNSILAVNLTGAFNCCRAVAPAMKERRYGRIVNISSGAGRSTSLTGIQAYTSAKAGQIGLTRQLAQELGPWGITVNNIAPGFVLSNPTTQRQWESYGEEGQAKLVESIALKRLGAAEDIAHGVLFFASDYAAWCTGQVLSIDGGKAMF
jgi:3-oxoacyl-[acyl-carrier protein] reductase